MAPSSLCRLGALSAMWYQTLFTRDARLHHYTLSPRGLTSHALWPSRNDRYITGVVAEQISSLGAGAYSYFLPWLVFLMVDRGAGPGVAWAASVAAVCAAGNIALALYRGQRPYSSFATLLLFVGILLAALSMGAADVQTQDPRIRLFVAAAITAILACSLLVRTTTEDYLRSLVAPQVWATEALRRLNRQMTAGWAVSSAAVAVSFGLALVLTGPVARTLCDWLVPFIVALTLIRWDRKRWQTISDRIVINQEDGTDIHAPFSLGTRAASIPESFNRTAGNIYDFGSRSPLSNP
jgi:hypothetical protein